MSPLFFQVGRHIRVREECGQTGYTTPALGYSDAALVTSAGANWLWFHGSGGAVARLVWISFPGRDCELRVQRISAAPLWHQCPVIVLISGHRLAIYWLRSLPLPQTDRLTWLRRTSAERDWLSRSRWSKCIPGSGSIDAGVLSALRCVFYQSDSSRPTHCVRRNTTLAGNRLVLASMAWQGRPYHWDIPSWWSAGGSLAVIGVPRMGLFSNGWQTWGDIHGNPIVRLYRISNRTATQKCTQETAKSANILRW